MLASRGLSTQLFGGFPALTGKSPTEESSFSASEVEMSKLGRRLFVRYGKPRDLRAARRRDRRWSPRRSRHPGRSPRHHAVQVPAHPAGLTPTSRFSLPTIRAWCPRICRSLKTGRVTPFSMILPPGYFEPQNQNVRYPVIYFGHGTAWTRPILARASAA